MKYKGYEAAINLAEDDDCFVGTVVNIEPPTIIAFDGQTIEELKTQFHESIDSYLANCQNPKPAVSGKMTLRMTPEVHAGVMAMARTKGLSANKFINQALQDKLSV